MIIRFFESLYQLFVDMSFYMMIGLLFVGILHFFLTREWVIKHVGQNRSGSVIKAALFGVPLPLCSCGVIPTGVFLSKNGASIGAVSAFLISTPQTGIDSIIATYGMMGIVLAVYRPVAAFLSGVIGGMVINLFTRNDSLPKTKKDEIACECHSHSETYVVSHSDESAACCGVEEPPIHSDDRTIRPIGSFLNANILKYAYGDFLKDITGHFVIGLVISAVIAVIIPDAFFTGTLLGSGFVSMLLMILVGIPMYICSTSSIPIALTFIAKGISPGAAFVFLFAGPVTNAASLSVLTKVLGKKVMLLYVSLVAVLSVIFGLLLDIIMNKFNLSMDISNLTGMQLGGEGLLKYIIAVVFFMLILWHLITQLFAKIKTKRILK